MLRQIAGRGARVVEWDGLENRCAGNRTEGSPGHTTRSGRMTGNLIDMYYVYFLLLSNGNVYKGSCADLRQRVQQHETGKVASTKPYRPFKLIGYEAYVFKSDAQRRERFLKTTEGRRLLRQQYRDILEKGSK